MLIEFNEPGNYILYNDAPGPFPDGDPLVDYFTGNGALDSMHGPNTRTMMRFEVTGHSYRLPRMPAIQLKLTRKLAEIADLRNTNGLNLPIWDVLINPHNPTWPHPEKLIRRDWLRSWSGEIKIKTLNEGFDQYGRLIQLLGTDTASGAGQDGLRQDVPRGHPSRGKEQYAAGTVEVWDIYNTTGDTHPIHFHLVNVQIIGRAPFAQDDDGNPSNGFVPSGAAGCRPIPNERG